ncbi:DUF493 domain-containing protein [Helicobacter canis]|uniref:Uncharacterized protein n=1 Tax=Helicobacter canis NCTC 12740 TaxID=1357399 RepID=V8CK73_9HELI|nr:DUF493 domain-containing protein [Helicobacter canis]ETD27462.1 hypothetical protein HMPREF2087_00380 [Helicobacter canis NCTC 12740]
MRHIEGKPEIHYPCLWEFRIIGEDKQDLERIVGELVAKPYTLDEKNHSSKGRFVSMHLIVEVESEEERNALYQSLSTHKAIKMVL